jgi:hypothetical protein
LQSQQWPILDLTSHLAQQDGMIHRVEKLLHVGFQKPALLAQKSLSLQDSRMGALTLSGGIELR